MTEISEKTIEAIKTAIQMEEDGYKYYMSAAEETNNEMGKAMFKQLAKDEMEHRRVFSAMFDQLADRSTWQKLAEQTPGIPQVPVFKERAKELDQSKGMAEDANALRIGMENEKKSIEYYEKTALETNDKQARAIFNNIKEQEEYHYNLLQAELDSVMGTGFWFDTAEFRMDGKF